MFQDFCFVFENGEVVGVVDAIVVDVDVVDIFLGLGLLKSWVLVKLKLTSSPSTQRR